jgi:hypothetical protein
MQHRRSTALLAALAGLALALPACSDRGPTATDADPAPPLPARAQAAASQADMEALARGIAAAMGSPEIRRLVLEDLRDSPFRQHRLHLASYLRGARGAAVAAAAAERTGMSPGRFAALLNGAGGVQLSLPLGLDRVRWAGTPDVVVTGHAVPRSQVSALPSLQGFRPGGEPVAVPLGVTLPYPLLVLAPAEEDFGTDPEARRAAAPRRDRRTVSTPDDEMAMITSEGSCGPYVRVCIPEPTYESPPGGQSLPSGFSAYSCTYELPAGSDPDGDGIRNDCEDELAYAFRPYLQFSLFEQYDGRQSYYAVRKVGPAEFKIFYLLGYFKDGGHVGTGVGWHYGDAEFIVMRVVWSGGVWGMNDAFLSAHWGKYGFDSSSLRGYNEFNWPSGIRKRPKIWVAEDKHANFSSQGKCDEGANYADNCDQPRPALDSFQALPGRNIGNNLSGDILVACDSRVGDPYWYVNLECFWTGTSFSGWTSLSPAAGGYASSLEWAGF